MKKALLLLTFCFLYLTSDAATKIGELNYLIYTSNNTAAVTYDKRTSKLNYQDLSSPILSLNENIEYGGGVFDLITIDSYAFYYAPITIVNLPYTIKTIREGAFQYCNLSEISIANPTPPIISLANSFSDETYNNAILYVPAGSLELYQKAPYWERFLNVREMTSVLPGDSNDNGTVTVADVITTAYHLIELPTLTWNFENADVTCDKVISTADVTATVDIILNESTAESANNKRRVKKTSSEDEYSLKGQEITIRQKETRTIVVSLVGNDNKSLEYTGFQFDLSLPQGVNLVSATKSIPIAKYEIEKRTLENGNIRIIVYGNGSESSSDNELVYLTLFADSDATPGTKIISVSNLFLADTLGQDIFGDDSEFSIIVNEGDADSGQNPGEENPDLNNPQAEPNPSDEPTASDDRNSDGWFGNFNGTYVSAFRIREGNQLSMTVETPEGGYNDEWDYIWKDSEGMEIGNQQTITTNAALYQTDYDKDYQIRRMRNYNVTLTSYGPENDIWAQSTLYTTPVYIYKRPDMPTQLVRKGDGTSCTFIVMMGGLSDEELSRYGYTFVYGYYDSNGEMHELETTPLRYTHTTSEIYNDPANRFWAYSLWTFADGSIVSSGLRFLDGTADEDFDASVFEGTSISHSAKSFGKAIYTLDGRYVGDDESRLEPGIYLINGKKQIIR